MNLHRRTAVAALTAAGLLWGTTVPLTKLALAGLPPGWLTVARFGLAAAVLLAAVRFRVRAACSPAVLAWGAVGYGASILVQNAGITRTSVSHAALLVGATPVLVAVIEAVRHHRVARPVAWMGFAVALVGVGRHNTTDLRGGWGSCVGGRRWSSAGPNGPGGRYKDDRLVGWSGRLRPATMGGMLDTEVAHLALDDPRVGAQPPLGDRVPQQLSSRGRDGQGQPPRGKSPPGA